MTQLLIDEPPLQVLPSLATLLHSADKAIILQQFNYWLQRSTNVKDGYKWIYNSYAEWHKQFPWIASEKTLKRYISDLEKQGLLISGNYNKAKFDRTKWYRIDYDALADLRQRGGQFYPTMGTDLPNGGGQLYPTNTNRLPETTTEDKIHCRADAQPDNSQAEINTIINYLNQKTGKHFKATTNKTKSLIKARIKEGFTVDDFKKVIDIKTAKWLHDRKMSNYLRPETLFGTKFEGYLNEKTTYQHAAKVPYWQKSDYQPQQYSDAELAAMEKENAELMDKLGLNKERKEQ